MPNVIKPSRLIGLMTVSMLYLSIPAANASPLSSRLDDFHPNCDIRKLSLTREQHSELRMVRDDYKKALDNAMRKNERSSHQRRREIVRILSGDPFNQDAARNYVSARYLSSIDFAIDELQVQHRVYQLLSPEQRRQWLDACLK